jgi:hypothetical protein
MSAERAAGEVYHATRHVWRLPDSNVYIVLKMFGTLFGSVEVWAPENKFEVWAPDRFKPELMHWSTTVPMLDVEPEELNALLCYATDLLEQVVIERGVTDAQRHGMDD